MKRLLCIAFLLVSTSAFATVVQPIGAAPQVLIPAAGSTAGGFGLFFRSDISVINLTTHDQVVSLQWLPEVAAGGTTFTRLITIPALTGIRSSDFVIDYMRTSGLGAIVVTGLTDASSGTIDSSARLYVSSRIWSPQPGSSGGTVSQSFPAVPMNTINTPIAAFFGTGGADNFSNYRVNVGIVNLDPVNAQTFVISVAPAPGPPQRTITLPPMTMEQTPVGNGLQLSSQITVQNITPAATASNLWTSYASTVDDTSGDAWSEMAVVGTNP